MKKSLLTLISAAMFLAATAYSASTPPVYQTNLVTVTTVTPSDTLMGLVTTNGVIKTRNITAGGLLSSMQAFTNWPGRETNSSWNFITRPILGWDSWWESYQIIGGHWCVNTNVFNASWITNIVLMMKANGMLAAGYNTICFNDGWQASARVGGHIVPNPVTFPDLPGLIAWCGTNGFVVEGYVNGTDKSCIEGVSDGVTFYPYSFINSNPTNAFGDARDFANLGFVGVVVDQCPTSIPGGDYWALWDDPADPVHYCWPNTQSPEHAWSKWWSQAFNPPNVATPLCLTMTISAVDDEVMKWVNYAQNSQSYVISSFPNLLGAIGDYTSYSWYYEVSGAWTPTAQDMGPGKNKDDWCIEDVSASPNVVLAAMCMGATFCPPLRLLHIPSTANFPAITNTEILAVWEDQSCRPGYYMGVQSGVQIWERTLGNGTVKSVVLLNTNAVSTNVMVSLTTLGFLSDAQIRDIVNHVAVSSVNGNLVATVAAESARMFLIYSPVEILPASQTTPTSVFNPKQELDINAPIVSYGPLATFQLMDRDNPKAGWDLVSQNDSLNFYWYGAWNFPYLAMSNHYGHLFIGCPANVYAGGMPTLGVPGYGFKYYGDISDTTGGVVLQPDGSFLLYNHFNAAGTNAAYIFHSVVTGDVSNWGYLYQSNMTIVLSYMYAPAKGAFLLTDATGGHLYQELGDKDTYYLDNYFGYTNPPNIYGKTFTGNASGLTNLQTSKLSGGFTGDLKVVTNGVDTATYHVTNGAIMAVTAP